jgi:hypothetical protein
MRYLIKLLCLAGGLGIAINAQAFSDTATLTWTNNDTSQAIRGSRIEVSKDGGQTWAVAYTVGRGVTTRIVLLQAGQRWCYRVRAYTNAAQSDPSNVTCATVTVTTG